MNKILGCKNESSSIQVPVLMSSKPLIIKNLIILSLGFLLLFTAYNGLAMLQSTINREQGIGVTSQAIIYVSSCISSLLFPKYIIQKIGCKNTIALSMLTYLPYITSNFYPHWGLMIPCSIFIGIGGSLLWGAQCTYLNEISKLYTLASRQNDTLNSVNSFQSDVFYLGQRKENLNRRYSLSFSKPVADTTNGKYITRSLPNIYQIHELKACNKQLLISNNGENHTSLKPPVSSNFQKADAAEEDSDEQNITFKDDFINTIPALNLTTESSTENLNFNARNSNDNINIQHYITSDGSKSQHDVDFSYPESKFCGHSKGMTEFSAKYASIKNSENKISKSLDSITARFFGIHGMAYFSAHIWSNLMSYYVLQTDAKSQIINSSFTCLCGAKFCNIESKCSEHNLAEPSSQLRYLLTGICSSLSLCAVLLIALFLDRLEIGKKQVTFSLKLLMATCKLVKKKEEVLLIPLTFYVGMVQGFYMGDYTKSYIGCAWGTYHVGLVTVCYGSACALSSTASGWLVKRLGRLPIFLTAALISGGTNIMLLIWVPDPHRPFMFFMVAGMWGLFTGTFWSQLKAFYGILFNEDEEAAFACFYLWHALGFALSFAYSNHFCTAFKIYILLIISTVGILGYYYVETYLLKNKIKL